MLCPKHTANGGPFPEFLGQGSPGTPVFADGVQGSPKDKMIDNDIDTLLRKQMFDTFVLFVGAFQDGR